MAGHLELDWRQARDVESQARRRPSRTIQNNTDYYIIRSTPKYVLVLDGTFFIRGWAN